MGNSMTSVMAMSSLLFPIAYECFLPSVGEGQAEPGGGVKRGIILESLCYHKLPKSSPS